LILLHICLRNNVFVDTACYGDVTKETITNHKGPRMVNDEEDYHGLQMANLKNLGVIFQDA